MFVVLTESVSSLVVFAAPTGPKSREAPFRTIKELNLLLLCKMIRWVFPSAGGVLDPKALMKNPSKPSNLQMQQASAEYFRVFLRLKASDDNDAAVKYEPADLWHLGKDAPEAQKPLYKNMKVRQPLKLIFYDFLALREFLIGENHLPGRHFRICIIFHSQLSECSCACKVLFHTEAHSANSACFISHIWLKQAAQPDFFFHISVFPIGVNQAQAWLVRPRASFCEI